VTNLQHVAKIHQLCSNPGTIKAQIVDTGGVARVSKGCRKPGLGVDISWLFRTILSYLRHKCTKLSKLSTPSTPCRHPADTPPVDNLWLNNLWHKLLIRDRYYLFTNADTLLFFSANVIKKNINTLLGVDN
jgi:hypothetical protein